MPTFAPVERPPAFDVPVDVAVEVGIDDGVVVGAGMEAVDDGWGEVPVVAEEEDAEGVMVDAEARSAESVLCSQIGTPSPHTVASAANVLVDTFPRSTPSAPLLIGR